METGIIASNGIAFSPDDRTISFADSRQDTVWAYDLDIESGEISNRRVFISTKDVPARAEPVRHPTMCTFGGENYDVMYVTSATRMLEPQDRATQPNAGALFAIYGVGARGLPEPRFAGRTPGYAPPRERLSSGRGRGTASPARPTRRSPR